MVKLRVEKKPMSGQLRATPAELGNHKLLVAAIYTFVKFSSSVLRGMAPGASKRCQDQSTLGGLTRQMVSKHKKTWAVGIIAREKLNNMQCI